MNSLKQIVILTNRLGRRTFGKRTNQLFGFSIMVCTCVAASLGFFSKSVQTALNHDIANFLGAPMVVRSDQPLLVNAPEIEGLSAPVYTTTFTTGAISDTAYQSVALKGVSSFYPLQGELLIRNADGESALTGAMLEPNQAWLDQRSMDELDVALGDQVQVGASSLLVTGKIVFEPDRLTQLQHALPRILVSQQGLANTGISNDNDRGDYRVLFTGDSAGLTTLETQLPELISHDFDLLKPGAGRHPFSRISLRVERMLNVVLVLILLMCGGAAATLADHSVRQYAMPATLLRCMGLKRRVVAWSLCLQLLIVAFVMSLVGCLVGWLIQPVLIDIMQPHMVLKVADVALNDLVGPIGIGLVTVVTFVMPKLQQLGLISVSSVLRGQIEKPKRSYLAYLCATVLVTGMLWISSDNTQLTVMLVGAVIFLVVLSIGFGWGLSKMSAQAHRFFRGPMKVAVRSIGRSPMRHIAPLASVSIAMMALLMTVTLRGSFLDVLQIQMLDIDGNYIFSGLPENEQDAFLSELERTGAKLKALHPTVSAKLISVNGVAIDQALKTESDTREETRSKVRLSWAHNLPNNNKLLHGNWPETGTNEVSVEHEVMTDLGLKLGDKLSFQIGSAVLTSTISSQREYKSGGSRMMFWFMFAPDTLSEFDQRLMGGLLIKDKSQSTLSKLNRKFPQMRMTNLEHQISRIRDIMIVLTRLMNTTLALLLGGALVVIIASSFTTTANRRRHLSLMRALGLRRTQCYGMSIVEQLTIGLVACMVGILGVKLIAGLLFHNLFALSYQLDWWRALLLTFLISGVFATLGWAFVHRNLKTPVRLSA